MSKVITKHGNVVDSDWLARQRGWHQTHNGRWLKVSKNGLGVMHADNSCEAIMREQAADALPDFSKSDNLQ